MKINDPAAYLDTCHKLTRMKGLRQVVIGPGSKPFYYLGMLDQFAEIGGSGVYILYPAFEVVWLSIRRRLQHSCFYETVVDVMLQEACCRRKNDPRGNAAARAAAPPKANQYPPSLLARIHENLKRSEELKAPNTRSPGARPRAQFPKEPAFASFQTRNASVDWVPQNGHPDVVWNRKLLKTWSGRGDSNPWPPGPEP